METNLNTSSAALIKNKNRFSSISIGLHWLMLLLLVAAYATIELKGFFPKGGDVRQALKPLHSVLGITILMLVIVRIAYNAFQESPAIVPKPPQWQLFSSRMMHYVLYLFLVVVPVIGWLMLSAKGKPIAFFGFELPALIGPDRAFGKRLENLHETLAQAGYFLIGAHAIAALVHHYVLHDNTLIRMLPKFNNGK